MRTARHPAGILIAHTMPMLVLAALYASLLQVIHPLLDQESMRAWKQLAAMLGSTTFIATAYGAWSWWRRAPVHPLYAALVFVAYVPLLFHIGSSMSALFPFDVPRWMMPEDPELYAFRLMSLPLGHALFVLVGTSLPSGSKGAPVRDLLLAAAIPLLVYLFVQVVEPFRRSSDFEEHAWVVILVCLTIAFLFLVVRGITALAQRKQASPTLRIIVTVLIALVLPLLGLLVNNGALDGVGPRITGVFGDLSHPAFYLIAVLNAAVLIWPSSPIPAVRLLQFVLRSAGFTYVLYFFVLFLPLLPLSIVAVLAVGVGFLLLAPIMLFALQLSILIGDARFLTGHRSRIAVLGYALFAMVIIPGTIAMRCMHHRMVLRDALHHVYQSDPGLHTRPLDEGAIATVLERIEANRSGWRRRGSNTPFLTPLYNRIVLDNLTLSEAKARTLERIFLDSAQSEPVSADRMMPPSGRTAISAFVVESRYDEHDESWRSRVHLRVANAGDGQEEFVTRFHLPEGAWISGHYLVIAGDTVPGLLAEEKAASWVYSNIVSYRRDPSIMRRVAQDRIELRVFPVEARDMRSTGFEVLHKEAIALMLDGDTLQLGDESHAMFREPLQAEGSGVAYMPAGLKERLPSVTRTAHYHLVVDGSEGQRVMRQSVIERIRSHVVRGGLSPEDITLHIADAYGTSMPYGDEALAAFAQHAGHGGFFSDRVIRKVLSESCISPAPSYPLIVIVPSHSSDGTSDFGIMLDDLPDVAACIPENRGFMVLDDRGELSWRSFSEPSSRVDQPVVEGIAVRAWPDASIARYYLRDDGEGEIIVDMAHVDESTHQGVAGWGAALDLEGRYRTYLHRYEGGRVSWLDAVRGSFAQQVLMPVTAWLCLEDEAQRNALLRKQEEVLASDASLDAMDQRITSMSEPSLWWLLPLLLPLALRRPRRS